MPQTPPHGSHVIAVIETAWAAIRKHHPNVPHVIAITGRGDYGDVTWGHFAAGMWKVGDGQVSEVFASGELLGLGGRRVVETLLHEAAHGLADVRSIQDTSNKHRYHNQRFARLAKELGLQPPAVKDDVLGWSDCTITDATAERYKDVIEAIDAQQLPHRRSPWVTYMQWKDDLHNGKDTGLAGGETAVPTFPLEAAEDDGQEVGGEMPPPEPVSAPGGRDGVRITIACACEPPRKMQASPGSFEKGPVTCGVCMTDFVQAEPQRRRRRTPRAL